MQIRILAPLEVLVELKTYSAKQNSKGDGNQPEFRKDQPDDFQKHTKPLMVTINTTAF